MGSRLTTKRENNRGDFESVNERWEKDNTRLRHELQTMTAETRRPTIRKIRKQARNAGSVNKAAHAAADPGKRALELPPALVVKIARRHYDSLQ